MDEHIKNIIEIIESIEKRINAYWNFYIIVVLATVGWLMSSKAPFTTNQGISLTIAICLFFTASFFIMRAATKRAVAFEDELNLASQKLESPRGRAIPGVGPREVVEMEQIIANFGL